MVGVAMGEKKYESPFPTRIQKIVYYHPSARDVTIKFLMHIRNYELIQQNNNGDSQLKFRYVK